MMIITDKDLLELEVILLKDLCIAYCAAPNTFITDMEGDDQYNTGYVKRTIHATLNEWAHSSANVERRNAYIDVDYLYRE